MKPVHSKSMRVLSIALVMLASTTSLWAQGQISESQSLSLEASRATSSDILTLTPLPPTPLTESSGVEMIEASRQNTLIDQPMMPLLPPTPVMSADNSPSIQPVPEPSTFAFCGLALGLMAIMGVRNKARNVKIQDAPERF